MLGLHQLRVDDEGGVAERAGDAVGAVVPVAHHDDTVDVLGHAVLGGVRGGRPGDGAARAGGQRVGVRVVAEAERPLHPAADGVVPVLLVGDLYLERHRVAPVDEAAVAGSGDGHLRRGVAHGDLDGRQPELALRVADPQTGGVLAELVVGVRGRHAGGVEGSVAVEVPLVLQLARLGVGGRRAAELDGEGSGAAGALVDGDLRLGRLVPRGVVDAVQARLGVLAEEAVAVVEHVQRPVGAELDVHRAVGDGHRHLLQLAVRQEVLDRGDRPVRARHGERGEVVLRELREEELIVPVLRELGGGGVVRVVVVDRAAHRALAVLLQVEVGEAGPLGGLVGVVVAVVQVGRGRGGQLVQAGVPAGGVRGPGRAVEPLTRLGGGEVPVVVVEVVARAVRPAAVHRLGDGGDVPLHVPHRAARGVGGSRVGTVVAPRDRAGAGVDVDAERVAHARHEDLGTGLRGPHREQVAVGDRVRPVVLHLDPQDLAPQVVGVARAAPRVEAGVHPGGVVVGREAVGAGRARRGVVTGREVEVAVVVPVEVAGDVAALPALGLDLDDDLLGGQVEGVAGPLEPGELVVALPLVPVRLGGAGGQGVRRGAGGGGRRVRRRHGLRRVVDVDPLVLGEPGVDPDRLEAVLGVVVHRDGVNDLGDAGGGVGQPDVAGARGVQHAQVGQHGHVDRLADALGEGDLLVARPLGRGVMPWMGIGGDGAGRRQRECHGGHDAAEQGTGKLQQLRLFLWGAQVKGGPPRVPLQGSRGGPPGTVGLTSPAARPCCRSSPRRTAVTDPGWPCRRGRCPARTSGCGSPWRPRP